MQKCFDEKDIQMLQEVITKMDPTVGYLVLFENLSVLNSWWLNHNLHCVI